MFDALVAFLLNSKKAIGGAIGAALVGLLAQHNVLVDSETADALTVVLSAVVGFIVVWFAPKNKEK